jgi:teichuronic acid biosynthesis glycosyltransferase TuaG
MNPFFSIIIPVYNCEKTIEETLKSVLSQTINDYEIIIINDSSSDSTMEIVEKFKDKFNDIKVISNIKNLGVAESRNKGFLKADGKYVALLDGDDVWANDKLEKQRSVINSTGCDICCTAYNFIDSNSLMIKKTYNIPDYIDYKMLLKENYIGCSTVTIKKNLLLGNSMNSNFLHEDYAFWLRLSRNGAKIIGINEPLVYYRILADSRSFNKFKSAKGRFKIYLNQEKFGLIKSLYYFFHYAANGIMKKLL